MKRNICLVLVAIASCGRSEAGRYQALLSEAIAWIETETGRALPRRPELQITTPDGAESLFTAFSREVVALCDPGLSEERRSALAKEYARLSGRGVFAFYAPEWNLIYVVPENFRTCSERLSQPRVLSDDFVRMVFVHELGHVVDEQTHAFAFRPAKFQSFHELSVWLAVWEGHAQYRTHRILESKGQSELFALMEQCLTSPPPGLSVGEQAMFETNNELTRFAYVDGFRFFQGLARLGVPFERALTSLPKDKSVILHPERYGRPIASSAAKDLSGLWKDLRVRFQGEREAMHRQVDESTLMVDYRRFSSPEKIREVADSLEKAEELYLVRPGAEHDVVCFGIYQMKDEASAQRMYALLEEVSRGRDLQMKEGNMRIIASEFRTMKGYAPRHLATKKTYVYNSLEVAVSAVIEIFKERVLVVSVTMTAVSDDEFKGRLSLLRDALDR